MRKLKLEEDIALLFENQYKSEVAINTLLGVLLKKKLCTLEEFEDEMKEIRRKVRDE